MPFKTWITSQSAESLEEARLEAVRDNNVELVQDILRELSPFTHRSNTAAELSRILNQPHFQVHSCSSTKLWNEMRITHSLINAWHSMLLMISLCWRPTTLWPLRHVRLRPRAPALSWSRPSTAYQCQLMPSAWWESAKWLESTWWDCVQCTLCI